ncbi:MAG: outer membrane protein [Alphaproteobacteria bacterium]
MKFNSVVMMTVLGVAASGLAVKTGSYVGLNAGYANLKINGKMEDNQGGTTLPKIKKAKGGMQVNLFAGHETVCTPNLIYGIEGSFGTSFEKIKQSFDVNGFGDDRTYKARQVWKAGLAGLVGTPVTDRVTIYGKLGLVYGRFETKLYGNPAQMVGGAAPNQPGALYRTNTAHLVGIEPGVRLKMDLTENWSTQVDASYAMYQKTQETAINENNVMKQLKYSPRVWGVTLGLSRKF